MRDINKIAKSTHRQFKGNDQNKENSCEIYGRKGFTYLSALKQNPALLWDQMITWEKKNIY